MSFSTFQLVLDFIQIFFTLIAFIGGPGIFLSIFLYITFPKKVKEDFFQTHPDPSARIGYDSYKGEVAFPFLVSLVLFSSFYKKKMSPHFDFRSKLSKAKIRLFYLNLIMISAGIFGLVFGVITMLISAAIQ
jgi:hypothetical protein